MKIAIIGYGKMGKMVEKAALQKGHQVVSIIDPQEKGATSAEINSMAVKDADVCIDFTSPKGVIGNIEKLCALKKNVVVGTTGWYGSLESVKKTVNGSGNGFIYASNFSIGMNVMFNLTRKAAEIFNKFPDYDVGGIEYHHSQKADSPSGTAKSLAEILVKNIERKKNVQYKMSEGVIAKDAIHFPSLRTGFIPGTHKIIFDSAADTIEISHSARSREGFALGAIIAAEWLAGKKGFYTINDLMAQMLGEELEKC